jgi:formylglycine-generating enzyme required for sulfatase activity
MSLSKFHLIQSKVTLALVYVLAICNSAALTADDSILRVANDCVIPLVRIAQGTFEMGRSSCGAFAAAALSIGEQGDWANQSPVRKVTISKDLLIGKYKITAEQFCRFLNSTMAPEQFVSINEFSNIEKRDGMYHPREGRNTYPINVVHWDGAKAFCQWLSKASGRTVRLPTEAEWEYVARGAEGRRTPWGNKEVTAWSSTKGSSVDAFPENATPEGINGLVDYVVGEWCSDFYGVRYISSESIDPTGPTKDELPVKSDLPWLATVKGEYHVQRGRVKHSNWSTTSRDCGDLANNGGIYGFRIAVETDGNEKSP